MVVGCEGEWRRIFRVLGTLSAVLTALLLLIPQEVFFRYDEYLIPMHDKESHVLVFGMLGLVVMLAAPRRFGLRGTAAMLMLGSAATEALQPLVHRSFQFGDLLFNFIGAAAGIWAAIKLRPLLLQRKPSWSLVIDLPYELAGQGPVKALVSLCFALPLLG